MGEGLCRCQELLHEMGAHRLHAMISLGTRIDRLQTIDDKIDSVQDKLRVR